MTVPGCFAPDGTRLAAPKDLTAIEETLGIALRDFASELRLTDAADFAAFIRLGQMANLRNIVQSSAELFFKPGAIELAEPGEIELGWFAPPLITLPMTFGHKGVLIYFRLRLAALSAAIEVESTSASDGAEGDRLLLKLREALHDARGVQPPPAGARSG
jgi:hypothetical protein